MSEPSLWDYTFEPGEYDFLDEAALREWLPALSGAAGVSRRGFLAATAGVVVALLVAPESEAQRPRGGRRGFGPALPGDIGAWLHIAEDGAVTAYTGKVEVGQNIRTSLTQVVAEELRTPVASVRLLMGDTDRVPFDMGTFGSRTTPTMARHLRRVAAATRELLLDLAAEKTKLDRGKFTVANGKVTGPEGKSDFHFGQLTRGKKLVKVVGEDISTTPADKWTVEGTSVAKVDGKAFVTGAHAYASDVRRPGMLYGKVLRPPAFKAKLVSVQTRDAEGKPGVKVVRDGDFVGVVAANEHDAARALDAIKAEWKTVPQISSKELFKHLKEHPSTGGRRGGGGFGGGRGGDRGSVKEGLKAADHKLEATYTVAYIAHTPLEPRAAVAEWSDGKLTVWTGTQRPFGVRGELGDAFDLVTEKIRVIMPDTGSGYGGKHSGECAVEAARLAKAAGKPVKLVWTRREEFTWAYFRPAGVIEVKGGVKKDGTLIAWEQHNYNSGPSSLPTPYEVANTRAQFHPCEQPLRTGAYRALAATANTFARESHMDDLARLAKIDPLEFRLKHLKDERLRAVLEAAAKRFGWGRKKPAAGHGFGIAGGKEKGGWVATCAEVKVDRAAGEISVVRLVTAFDCGAILNPLHLTNQVEGAVVMGLGGALFEQIQFADGKVLNPRLSAYRVPHFSDLPKLETVLINRKEEPSAGAGETPIVAVAPAVGNAVCAATGVRLRSMPMAPDGFKVP
jgi:isoquinoline 1-oxidoreductase